MTLAINGADPLRTEPFPARNTYGTEEKEAALKILDSGKLSAFRGAPGPYFNGGPEVRAFEQDWCDRYGYEHAVTVNSWTTGLIACLKAVGVRQGDEVIVPPYTMSATATAVRFCGARVRFADISEHTFCIDPASVEAHLTRRTRAVVAVHLFGHPADMRALKELCERHGIALVEDGAQSPGVWCDGQPVGAIGDIGGFSLTQTKHIHTGEGGVIVTDNTALADYCRAYRNHGENLSPPGPIGGNYRLTELQAAMGRAQLPKLPPILDTRQRLAQRLSRRLRMVPGLTPPTVRDGCTHAYFTYPIRYDAQTTGVNRQTFVEAVNAECSARVLKEGYVEPLHYNPVYASGAQTLPVVERMHETELVRCRMVREPLTEDDMDDIAEAIEKVAGNVDELRGRAA